MKILKLIFTIFLLCIPVSATITKVQEATATAVSGATIDVIISAPTSGNSLIACIGHNLSRTITGVSGGGVTWVQGPNDATNYGVDIWYGHNSSGIGTTITVSLSSGVVSRPSVNVTEWSGLNNAVPESINTNTGAIDATQTSNSVISTSANSLIIATFANSTGVYSSGPTNSFTRLTAVNTSTTILESGYRIVSSTGTYSTGFTYTVGIAWGAAIAAFGAPVSGPTNAQRSAGFFMNK